jgi:hypothetical protein
MSGLRDRPALLLANTAMTNGTKYEKDSMESGSHPIGVERWARGFEWIHIGSQAMARHTGRGLNRQDAFSGHTLAFDPARDGALCTQLKRTSQSRLPADGLTGVEQGL